MKRNRWNNYFQRPPGSSIFWLKIHPRERRKRKSLTKMSVYWKPAWSRCRQLSSSQLSGFQQVNIKTIFFINLILFVTVEVDDSLNNIILNHQNIQFLTTYITSIISAALGLAKCLKNGVARPIAPGGPLDGLLTGKFVLAFLASGVGLVVRGLCIGFTLVSHCHYQKKC